MRARAVAGIAAVALLCSVAACGSSTPPEGDAPLALQWYVPPDRLDVSVLAQACSDLSEGAYTVEVTTLPSDFKARRDLLVRRLANNDDDIDLIALDTSMVAEFAAAQFLAPLPEDRKATYAEDIFPAALAAASFDEQLVAAPWWFDPALLWSRGNVAERAGLDLTAPISWDELIAGAERVGTTIEFVDPDGTAVVQWVNALVAGAGGSLVDGPGRDAKVGLDSAAGRATASIVEFYRESVGADPSREALTRFASPAGGFLIAPSSVVSDPALATIASDLQWAPYPVSSVKSVASLSGVALAVPLYSPNPAESYQVIDCLTSPDAMEALMITAGHSSSRFTTYDRDAVEAQYPLAKVTKPAVQSGVSVPSTPYWALISAAIAEEWEPLSRVSASTTPKDSQDAVVDRLAGGLR